MTTSSDRPGGRARALARRYLPIAAQRRLVRVQRQVRAARAAAHEAGRPPVRPAAPVPPDPRQLALDQGQRELNALTGSDNQLHLGAGTDIRPGWVNVDLWPSPPAPVAGATIVLHDLRRGLQVPPQSCRRIYSSHFFEHVTWRDGEALLGQCFAAMAPEGRFRLAVPDFGMLARRYVAGDEEFFETTMPRRAYPIHSRAGGEAIIDWMNYAMYQDGEHVCMFDGDKAVRLLTAIGFRQVRVTEFDPEWDFDSPERRALSLYVEGRR